MAGAILQGNTTLKYLNISMNHIGPSGADSIGILLKYSYVIERLNLSRNEIGDDGVEAICAGLEHPMRGESALTHLNLDWNSIHDVGGRRLARMLTSNSTLDRLQLASNGIGDDGVTALVRSLEYNQILRELDLVGNQIQDGGAMVVAEHWCRSQENLTNIKLDMNCISFVGEARLQAAIEFRRNRETWLGRLLRQIEAGKTISINLLDEPQHGDDELLAIAAHVARYRPQCITTFCVGNDEITNRGIEGLARDVLANRAVRIERLYVSNMPFYTSRGISLLAMGLATNVSLRVFSLCKCKLGVEGAHALAKGLARNVHLLRLDLSDNQIGDDGAMELITTLSTRPHPSLVSINFSNNQLSDATVGSIIKIQRIEELILADNRITDFGALDLCKVFANDGRNCSLRWLNLSGNNITSKGTQALQIFLPDNCILESGDSQYISY